MILTFEYKSTQIGNIQGAGLSLNQQQQLDTPFATDGSTGIDLRVANAQGNLGRIKCKKSRKTQIATNACRR